MTKDEKTEAPKEETLSTSYTPPWERGEDKWELVSDGKWKYVGHKK